MEIIDEKFREKWKNYIWQSLAAGISIALILILFTSAIDLVIIAAVGASAFTVFAIPKHVTAQTKNVIGGQAIGAAVGLICSLLPLISLQGGLAVFLATLLMVTLDTEHPPAAGTALGLAINPSSKGAIFVLSAVIILSLIKMGLSDQLQDLT